MKIFHVLAVLTALTFTLLPLAARADGASLGVSLETTGAGISIADPLGFGFQARLQSGNFGISQKFNANGNTYNGRFNLSNILLTLEFHPLNQKFFAAAGGMFNGNKVTGSTSSSGVIIGNTNYGAGSANATVTWKNFAPYLGIGWGPPKGSGFGFDLGAAFQGPSRATVTTSIAGVSAADLANAQNQIQGAVNYQVYPVIGVRYSIGF